MELSPEDNLRLNVLVANARAIRIDESKMKVYGLAEYGEASVTLQPTGNDDRYLRLVRELLATHALGSPRGYPVFLRRWTRMHRLTTDRLAPLLMLGEPEAVVAVAGASNIDSELAKRAWWALSDSEVARFLLEHECVIREALGRELAAHLLEFLPFETEQNDIIQTVRLICRPGLIEEPELLRLWHRGARKTSYLTGFLLGRGENLPELPSAHPALKQAEYSARLNPSNSILQTLCKVLAPPGQALLLTCYKVLTRPAGQEAVMETLETLRNFLDLALAAEEQGEIEATVDALWHDDHPLSSELITARVNLKDDSKEKLNALLVLARSGEPLVRDYFIHSSAVGSLMRKQLAPILKPVENSLRILLWQR